MGVGAGTRLGTGMRAGTGRRGRGEGVLYRPWSWSEGSSTIGEYSVPPNSAKTSRSLSLGILASGLFVRLIASELVGTYLMISRTSLFCCLLLQQNHSRTERIESATTPLTVPAMIGPVELLDDGCADGVGEGVGVAKLAAMTVVDVESVDTAEDVDNVAAVTVTDGAELAVFEAIEGEDVGDDAFADVVFGFGGASGSGHHEESQASTEQQPFQPLLMQM